MTTMPRNATAAQIVAELGGAGVVTVLMLPSSFHLAGGANIDQWTDLSGNGNHATIGANFPQLITVNGVPSGQFNGTNQSLAFASTIIGATTACEIIGIARQDAAGGINVGGNAYLNPPMLSDGSEWKGIYMSTVAAVDSLQFCTFGAAGNTAAAVSPSRSMQMINTFLRASDHKESIALGGSAFVAAVAGANPIGGTANMQIAHSGLLFGACTWQALLICGSTSLSDPKRAWARKVLGRICGAVW